jgi:hypothetical protein
MPYLRSLRASAWTLFVMGILHLFGHLQGTRAFTSPPDEATRSLAQTMMRYSVNDYPIDRSIASIYLGFSLFFSAAALVIGALVLLSATALRENPKGLRPIVRTYTGGLLVLTAISVNYFVWPPTICLLIAFGLAAFALVGLRKAA